MTQVTMSITRALSELKRLDERINRDISQNAYIGITIGKGSHKKMLSNQGTPDAVSSKIESSYKSIVDLMTRRSEIKSKVVLSNAQTLVSVGGKQITVAEAIELKKSVGYSRALLNAMRAQYSVANGQVNAQNEAMEQTIEKLLSTVYGSDKSKIDTQVAEAVSTPQRVQKTAELLDPLNLSEKIKEIEEKISLVDTELDYSLSEVNAKTEIIV